jgi:hypothetical protein
MDPIPKKLLPAALSLIATALILPGNQLGAQVSNPAPIQLLATAYADLNGDHDAFPDTGETGRLTLTVKNIGAQALTGIVFNLVSTDADVSCITEHAVAKATLAPGEVATIGSLTAGPAGFTFRASDSLNSVCRRTSR